MQSLTFEDIRAIPFLKTLGITITEIGDRHAVMDVVIDDRHLNYMGVLMVGCLRPWSIRSAFSPDRWYHLGRN